MKHDSEDYQPLFELGFYQEDPACKVLNDFQITPLQLATLTVTLFETVMRAVGEDTQIQYEKEFTNLFKYCMRERHRCDITVEYEDEE